MHFSRCILPPTIGERVILACYLRPTDRPTDRRLKTLSDNVFLFLALIFLLPLASCGGGGGSASTATTASTTTTVSGQAILGPLSGATIDVSSLNGNLLGSGTAQVSTSLASAGSFSLALPLPLNAPVYLVTSRGGTDIDPTDSGVASVGTVCKGVVHAYVTATQLQAGNFNINPLTEIIYQDIASQYPNGVTALTAAQWTTLLNTETLKFLNASTSYADVLAFSPAANKANSKIAWNKVLAKLVKGIHDGDDGAAMLNRAQLLNDSLLAVATTLSADGNTIERLEDIGGDRVKTDVAKNAAGQVDVLEQKYVDASGAVVVVRATRMNTTQSYLRASISKSGHTLSIEGVTTLLNGKTFSTGNMAQFVSKLVSISAPNTASLDITLDKSVSSRISANELVFAIDGNEPTASELNILLDDPKINWKWSMSAANHLSAKNVSFINKISGAAHGSNLDILDDGTAIIEVSLPDYDILSGLQETRVSVVKQGLKNIVVDVFGLPGALVLEKNPLKALKAKILSVPSDFYFSFSSGIPTASESFFTSTRVALVGKLSNGKIIPREKYTPVLFIRNKHANGTVLNISLSKDYVLQGIPMNGRSGPLYTAPRESMIVANLMVTKNKGYIIIPSKKVSFSISQAGNDLFPNGIPIVKIGTQINNKWEVVRYEKLTIGKTTFASADFNYAHIGSNVTLNAASTVASDGVVPTSSYIWSANGNQIGTGKVLNVANSVIDPNNKGFVPVTLNVTSLTGFKGLQTKVIALNTKTWDSVNLTKGLIAYYPFDGNANDASGNGKNALAVGTPSYAAGFTGQAISISEGNYLRVPAVQGFKPGSSSFTYTAKVFLPNASVLSSRLFSILTVQGGDYSEGASFRLTRNVNTTATINIALDDAFSGQNTGGNASVSYGQWHSVVFVLDRVAGTVSSYVDGTLAQREALTVTGSIDPTWDMLIGAYSYSSARNGLPQFVSAQGKIDELRIYNRALSDAEITQLVQ